MTWEVLALVVILMMSMLILLIMGPPIQPEDRGLVLRALSAGEMTGGEVMNMTGLSPSNSYAILYGMEHRGLVASRWQDEDGPRPRRRVYFLTVEGTKALAAILK